MGESACRILITPGRRWPRGYAGHNKSQPRVRVHTVCPFSRHSSRASSANPFGHSTRPPNRSGLFFVFSVFPPSPPPSSPLPRLSRFRELAGFPLPPPRDSFADLRLARRQFLFGSSTAGSLFPYDSSCFQCHSVSDRCHTTRIRNQEIWKRASTACAGKLIADRNERPNRITIIRRFLLQLVGTSLDRNDCEVINLLFCLGYTYKCT